MTHAIDQKEHAVVFERIVHATPAEVFDAWTIPDQLAEWWDPTGVRLVSCEIDLRPGGEFTFQNDAHSPPFRGVYKIVQPPTLLAFEAMGAAGTVSLTARGDGTHMQVTIRCASREHLEAFAKMGAITNTEKTLDNLVRRMGALQGAPSPRAAEAR